MASNKHEEIAQAAIRLFEKKGYHATSVQDIADEVGLQKGSLYHYISSKEDLLMQITHQAINGFNRNLEKIMNLQLPVREKFILAFESHLNSLTSNMSMAIVLLREAFSLGEHQHSVIQQATDQYLDLWCRILDEGLASGEFHHTNSRLTALSILGSLNWVYRWYDSNKRLSPNELAREFANIFLRGIERR
ncbi:TetR/AcrR family transcriptional regulator [Fodinisporobacter ferrooxydans]|uniref:TetR/AcrR family transcriptional regulator n=1 Tax=Fodinisporobacter ferrooxydans TaxID=2901836 RepID=A0ABY4CN31_9BACL|nr:TetR/AcrR family transcriptional regulator [Alicyclobacillaceae bacterium MYW30-H2]